MAYYKILAFVGWLGAGWSQPPAWEGTYHEG